MEDTLAVYHFTGAAPGPHLLVLGAIHGNEVCGTAALARLKLELDLGLITLACGQLTIVPVCNPAAYLAGKRFIDANLNRIVKHWDDPHYPEQHYANQVTALIEAADIVLDLHSYSAGTIPYVFLDYPTPENTGFARALGLHHFLTGWPELYQAAPNLSEGDTIQYAHEAGKRGVLVECGAHDDPASLAVASIVLANALAYCGMTDARHSPEPLKTWRVEHVITCDQEELSHKRGKTWTGWRKARR